MDLKDAIFKRKSIRKYDMTPLDADTMSSITAFLGQIKPLFENAKVRYEITSGKGGAVKAPHYLAIYCEQKDDAFLNAGFMFQQFSLFLTGQAIGSCWVGMGKPESAKTDPEYLIMIAFGKAVDSPYRDQAEFKRKTMEEISNVADKRLEVARLAPSAVNTQPWRLVLEGDCLHVYRVRPGAIKGLFLHRFGFIDIGIMLCHLFAQDPERFRAYRIDTPQEVKGCDYVISMDL